jgi:hypothetical protein
MATLETASFPLIIRRNPARSMSPTDMISVEARGRSHNLYNFVGRNADKIHSIVERQLRASMSHTGTRDNRIPSPFHAISDDIANRVLLSKVNYPTRYEVVLTNGVDAYLLPYTLRTSYTAVLDLIKNNGKKIETVAMGGWSGNGRVKEIKGRVGAFLFEGTNWRIEPTGRTQREVFQQRMGYPPISNVVEVEMRRGKS